MAAVAISAPQGATLMHLQGFGAAPGGHGRCRRPLKAILMWRRRVGAGGRSAGRAVSG